MRWNVFEALIKDSFGEPRLTTSDGVVLTATEPLDLPLAIRMSAETKQELEAPEMVGVFDVLEERFPTYQFLDFLWDGFGPTSSFASIEVVDLGPIGALACWCTEIPPKLAFALVRGDSMGVWSAFVTQLLPDNGQSFGIGLFGDLPSETANRRPDVLPPGVLKEAYWQWLEQAEGKGRAVWAGLRDRVLARLEQPNPLSRSTALLERLVRLGPEGYLEATKPDELDLSEGDRRLILDNYFDLTYRQ